MKILFVGPDKLGTEYGGGQVYINALIAELIKLQHNVSYLYTTFEMVSLPQLGKLEHNGISELHLVMPKGWRTLIDPPPQSKIIEAVASVLLDIRPDVIHAHGLKEYACSAANSTSIPCIVTAHHGGIVCPAGALLNQHDEICGVPAGQTTCLPCSIRSIPGGQLWWPLLRLIPLETQLRLGHWLRERRFLYFITPLGTLALSICKKLAAIKTIGKYATRLIAPTRAIRDALVRNGIPISKVVVVPHGIPLPQRQPLRHDMGMGPIRFMYVGRISHVKGIHVMLEAFSGLSPETYELHIVGGAGTKPEQRYLARLRKQYKSVNAIWHGARSHEEIAHQIESCDVTIHPAICLEVFGLTIAESLAVGRPVIASRCGGAEAQIRDGENGLLVPPNDVKALRQAVQSLIDKPECLQTMARKTGDIVSIDQHVRELEKVYIGAISGQPSKGVTMVKKIDVSIIIVSFNTMQLTVDCIDSIYKTTPGFNFEIIVVDNNSEDGTVGILKQKYDGIVIIENKKNNLFAKANNQAASIAKGEYLLLLNSDTFVQEGNLEKLITFLKKSTTKVACVGPIVLNENGTNQSGGYALPSVAERITMCFKLNKLLPQSIARLILPFGTPELTEKDHRVGWVSGCCMLIRKNIYLESGGLNEALQFYGEEPEFGYRLDKLGH